MVVGRRHSESGVKILVSGSPEQRNKPEADTAGDTVETALQDEEVFHTGDYCFATVNVLVDVDARFRVPRLRALTTSLRHVALPEGRDLVAEDSRKHTGDHTDEDASR